MKLVGVVLIFFVTLIGCSDVSDKVNNGDDNEQTSVESGSDSGENNGDEAVDLKEIDQLVIEKIHELEFPNPDKGIVQFYVDIKNNTDKAVKWFSLAVMTFDEDGYPIVGETSRSQYDDFELHGAIVRCDSTDTIKPLETLEKAVWWFEGEGVATIKVVIEEVEYHDGTSWVNPNLEQILTDENVIYR